MADKSWGDSLPSNKAHYFDAGQYFQSTTNSITIDRGAEELFALFTDDGMANWEQIFPLGASFERIAGGPGSEMALGDVLRETVNVFDPPLILDYTVAGLVPGRAVALEGHAVYEGVANPKVCALGVWMFFPESQTSTTVTRYFTAVYPIEPAVVNPASDPVLMQKMLEGLKAACESTAENGVFAQEGSK